MCFSIGTFRICPANSWAIYHFCYVSIKFLFKNSPEAASGTLCRHVFDIWARDAKCCSVNGTSSPWPTPSYSYSNLLCESQCLEVSRITLTSHPIFLNASLCSLQFIGKGCLFLGLVFSPAFSRINNWIIWAVPGPPWSCWQSPWRDAAPAGTAQGASASMARKLFPSAAWSCLLKMGLPH